MDPLLEDFQKQATVPVCLFRNGLSGPAHLRGKSFSIGIEQLEKLIGLTIRQYLTDLRQVPIK
jgi:hypothetical protein